VWPAMVEGVGWGSQGQMGGVEGLAEGVEPAAVWGHLQHDQSLIDLLIYFTNIIIKKTYVKQAVSIHFITLLCFFILHIFLND